MSANSFFKRIINTQKNKKSTDLALLTIRIVTALFMIFGHGIPKISLLQQSQIKFMDVMGVGPEISLFAAIFSEIGFSFLILIGLGSRIAAIPLMITMAVAAFVYHSADPFAVKEMAILYLVIFTAIFLQGSGKYSMDRVLEMKMLRT